MSVMQFCNLALIFRMTSNTDHDEPTPPRGRIVVLGMHRSGTSCIGELLMAMGAYYGPNPPRSGGGNIENPHGLFERPDLRRLLHSILQKLRSEWWATSQLQIARMPALEQIHENMLAQVLLDLNAHEPWFIKEPRLCLLLPMLLQRIGSVVAVCVWRNPMEVAESLRTRDAIPVEFGLALWERYMRAAVAMEVPKVLVSYNRLVSSPAAATRKLLEDLSKLGTSGLHMPDHRQLAQVVDPTLNRSRPRDPRLSALMTTSQRELLAALEADDLAHPELKRTVTPDQILKLKKLEDARRQQMSAAAYQSLADAKASRTKIRSLPSRISDAFRYIPLNPLWWLKQLRQGTLGTRLSQHIRACSIAVSGAFDADWYSRKYFDLATSKKMDPLLHFVRFGAAEGRDPAPAYSTKERLHNMLRMAEASESGLRE